MKTKRYLLLLLIACVSFAACAQPKTAAPDFELLLSTGERVKLSSYKNEGKAVMLHFWATWCPPCREELPEIDDMAKRFASSRRLALLCVCVGDEEKKRSAFMQKNGYTFTGGLDATGAIASLYGVSGIPTSVLIGADGKIQKVHIGRMSHKDMEDFTRGYD